MLLKHQKPLPVTALCGISATKFLAGFANGRIEEWDTERGFQKTWQAHEESVKNIKLFNQKLCITTSGNVMKLWEIPIYKETMVATFHTPVLTVLITSNPCVANSAIICFEEEPLQVWSC